jgi:hypothetical protein
LKNNPPQFRQIEQWRNNYQHGMAKCIAKCIKNEERGGKKQGLGPSIGSFSLGKIKLLSHDR